MSKILIRREFRFSDSRIGTVLQYHYGTIYDVKTLVLFCNTHFDWLMYNAVDKEHKKYQGQDFDLIYTQSKKPFDPNNWKSEDLSYLVKKCDCGGQKAQGLHAYWCTASDSLNFILI